MKSDEIIVRNNGEGIDKAIQMVNATAVYRGLSGKETIHLQLLAEEMLSMMRQIAGEKEGRFFVEAEGKEFRLHLIARSIITGGLREKLLSVSSSGKNAAAKGVMGKLRDIFERAFELEDIQDASGYGMYYARGMDYSAGPGAVSLSPFPLDASLGETVVSWSMQKYKSSVEEDKETDAGAKDEWDELEKSIVANIADEVKIGIVGNEVEMIIYKTFK